MTSFSQPAHYGNHVCLHDNPGRETGLRFLPVLKKAEKCMKRVQSVLKRLVVYFCRILFQKNICVVRKRYFEFFTLDSNPPLVNTRQISARVGLNPV